MITDSTEAARLKFLERVDTSVSHQLASNWSHGYPARRYSLVERLFELITWLRRQRQLLSTGQIHRGFDYGCCYRTTSRDICFLYDIGLLEVGPVRDNSADQIGWKLRHGEVVESITSIDQLGNTDVIDAARQALVDNGREVSFG